MAKRLCDIIFSSVALIICLPVLLIAIIGIKLTSKGPVMYNALRVGKDQEVFTMHKLRSMHVMPSDAHQSAITTVNDSRVFAFGKILRQLKVDEIPQFYDVLRGKMSCVGPRPEDPEIVKRFYTEEHLQTLSVRPGLTSPGSLDYYLNDQQYLSGDEVEHVYATVLLPRKLAIDAAYVSQATWWSDLYVMGQTVHVILLKVFHRKTT